MFLYSDDIQKSSHTTNAIESLISVIRKVINERKVFPSDEPAKIVAYLAMKEAKTKWAMPTLNWKAVLNRFMIEYENRLVGNI